MATTTSPPPSATTSPAPTPPSRRSRRLDRGRGHLDGPASQRQQEGQTEARQDDAPVSPRSTSHPARQFGGVRPRPSARGRNRLNRHVRYEARRGRDRSGTG